jgi:hypothetical protein
MGFFFIFYFSRYVGSTWTKRGGRWWKSPTSNYYYSHGKWRLSVRMHPTNPTLKWRAGRWVGRKLTAAQRKWVKRYGRWWRCAHCHVYYRNGRWVRERSAALADNPYYRRDRMGVFVKRQYRSSTAAAVASGKPATTGVSKATAKLLPLRPKYQRVGRLFWRTPTSLQYYRNQRWFTADPRVNDPRWRPRFARRCGSWDARKMAQCRKAKWHLLPKHLWKSSSGAAWVKVGGRWWSDKRRVYYWHRGAWKRAGGVAGKRRLAASRALRVLNARGGAIDLRRNAVNAATKKELSQFLNWFLDKSVAVGTRGEGECLGLIALIFVLF